MGLGIAWILDSLEVMVVGNLTGALAKPGSGAPLLCGRMRRTTGL